MVFSQISIFELFTNNNMIAAELQNCKVYYNVHRQTFTSCECASSCRSLCDEMVSANKQTKFHTNNSVRTLSFNEINSLQFLSYTERNMRLGEMSLLVANKNGARLNGCFYFENWLCVDKINKGQRCRNLQLLMYATNAIRPRVAKLTSNWFSRTQFSYSEPLLLVEFQLLERKHRTIFVSSKIWPKSFQERRLPSEY